MKAIVCNKPFELALTSRPAPPLSAGDVLVRIRRVGLCGTDYHIYAGRQPFLTYPRVMGHELSGEVVETTSNNHLHVGQIVAINPYLACGTCIACRRGKPNCCATIQVLGVHTDGGMCDYLAVPASAVIDATGLTLDQAAMVEFLAIGTHAVARAQIQSSSRVLVVGAGPIGIGTALAAKLLGADVTLIDTRPARLQYANARLGLPLGIEVTADIKAELRMKTGGDMFDCVFDATGNIDAMRGGLDYVAHGGTYVLVSVVKDDISFPDPEFHKRETTLLASRNALSGDFDRVIAAIKAGLIPTDALLTQSFAAAELPQRFPELIAGADHVIKAIAEF